MASFRLGAVLLHSAAAAVMARAWFQLDNLPNNAFVEEQVGGHFQFLTIQGHVFDRARIIMHLSDIY